MLTYMDIEHMQYAYTICTQNIHTEYASHKNNGYSAHDIKNLLGMMGIPTIISELPDGFGGT